MGSAPKVEVWFLLSYRGSMGAKAFDESTIPSSVKDHLNAQLESVPHSRLLLIKPNPQKDDGVTLQIVIGREIDPFYYSFEPTTRSLPLSPVFSPNSSCSAQRISR